MNIRVNDTYTVYPVDACNWSIIQRTPTVDEDGKPIIREKKLTKYFSRPQYALEWIYDQLLRDDPTECASVAELIGVLEAKQAEIFSHTDEMLHPKTPTAPLRQPATLKEPPARAKKAAKRHTKAKPGGTASKK